MWDAIVTGGGGVLCGLLFFFVAHWTDLERQQFSQGDGKRLE